MTLPDWCPKECGWRHHPDRACPKTKLPMPKREPGMEPGQEVPLLSLKRVLGEDRSTVHEVEARCPTPGCGVVRTLMIYAPPDKVTMDRLCDGCQHPRPTTERTYAVPYKD